MSIQLSQPLSPDWVKISSTTWSQLIRRPQIQTGISDKRSSWKDRGACTFSQVYWSEKWQVYPQSEIRQAIIFDMILSYGLSWKRIYANSGKEYPVVRHQTKVVILKILLWSLKQVSWREYICWYKNLICIKTNNYGSNTRSQSIRI